MRLLAATLLLGLATEVSAQTFVVRSGVETRIGQSDGAVGTVTCRNMSQKPIVTGPPLYGTATIRSATTRVTNPNSHCLGQVISGFAVYYRSRPGFRGRDRITVTTYLFNGRIDVPRTESAEIIVQ